MSDIKQRARKMFDEKFCLVIQTSEQCDKCRQTHLVRKVIGLLNKTAQERLNAKYPRKPPILDEELATPDKLKSFIDEIIDLAITEERERTVKDIYNGCKHYSNGNDDFAGTWIELYAKQKGIDLSTL